MPLGGTVSFLLEVVCGEGFLVLILTAPLLLLQHHYQVWAAIFSKVTPSEEKAQICLIIKFHQETAVLNSY